MTGPATPSDNGKKPPAVARQMAGHELPFVTPSTYLHLPTRPLASAAASPAAVTAANPPHSRTVPLPDQPPVPPLPEKPPMTPLDKDQVQGLVSNCLCSETHSIPRSSYLVAAFLPLTAHPPPFLRPHRLPVPRRRGLLLISVACCRCATCIRVRSTVAGRRGRHEHTRARAHIHTCTYRPSDLVA